MTPREIDALIVEHLFGWTNIRDDVYGNSTGLHAGKGMFGDWRDYADVPFYSTTGNGMLVVLAALRKDYWVHMLQRKDGWGVQIVSTKVGALMQSWWVTAKTLEMAVALAALKTRGVEVKQ